MRLRTLPFAFLLLAAPALAQESPSAAHLQADVTFLADDAQEGRGPGSEGIERAANYIANEFREAGLVPAPGADGYFQTFTITGSPRMGEDQSLTLTASDHPSIGELRRDFLPLSVGTAGKLESLPLVFAGYGITATDEQTGLHYDDYAGLDVRDKAVLLLRRAPGSEVEGTPFAPVDGKDSSYATFQHKLSNAYGHGARAVFLVNDLAGLKDAKDELLLFTSAGVEKLTQIPVVMLRREFADAALKAAGSPSLADLEKSIIGNDPKQPKPASRDLGTLVATGNVDIVQDTITTRNVVGVLPGKGPHADETIVIGGHYDHLGHGGRGSLAPFSKDIHNGADDNASGTALVVDLARRLASKPAADSRRLVFMAFSGEERGLLGSRYYVAHPLFPLESTAAMFNFDMVGRLNDKNQLTVFGADSAGGFRPLVETLGPKHGLEIRTNADVAGNSDHASFHEKEIPILFLFTGTHRDYHRPSDDTPLINFAGMARIADLAEQVIRDVSADSDRPQFVAAPPQPVGRVTGMKVAMGVIPDYDDSVKGLRLNGSRPGSAADKAGLKEGDIIISIGDRPIGTIYDYMESLGRFTPGDQVSVTILRDGKEMNLPVTLDAPASTHIPATNN